MGFTKLFGYSRTYFVVKEFLLIIQIIFRVKSAWRVMGDYQPLRSDDVHTNTHASTHTKPTVHYSKPMSPIRKFCFTCSVLLCCITIIVFLWVIPCEWAKCPVKAQGKPIMSWDRPIDGLG